MPVVEDSDDELSDILSEDLEDYGAQNKVVRCTCGAVEECQLPPGLAEEEAICDWVECTSCKAWQHQLCVKDSLGSDTIPEDYSCERCKVNIHRNKRDRRVSSYTVDESSVELTVHESKSVPVESIPRQEPPQPSTLSSIAVEISTSAIGTQLESARDKIEELEEDLLDLKQELSDRDASVADLRKEMSSLREAQKQRDGQAGCPIEELMEQNVKLGNRLKADLLIRDEGSKFINLTAKSREWFGSTKIDRGFEDVYGQSRQTFCRCENETVPFIPFLAKYEDLRKLVSKCLKLSTEDATQLQEAISQLSKLSPEAVVRALITSALAEWVFETDFPRFDDGPSEILSKYRELLATQGIAGSPYKIYDDND